jgi:crotonobetainyl-CoA:carnitine CoA-transferase CaiB-like acyl-CoA transferase
VKWADVVVENFTPGTLQKLGFGYEEMDRINPGIVMMSASMFGANGPDALQPGLGEILVSFAGFTDLVGWPDRPPVNAGPYTDAVACRIAAAVLFAALDHQRRTGRGCYIDLSQFETSLHFLSPVIMEYQATGHLLSRMGNRSLTDCPHGVFPTRGDDRWCALSVSDEVEWQAFCNAMEHPEWAADERFASFAARKQNEDALEKLVGEVTTQYRNDELMNRLQAAGVKAGLVADWPDLWDDPQMTHRGHNVTVEHPVVGKYENQNGGFRLSGADAIFKPAPLLGEQTEEIARGILGLSRDEFDRYKASGVFS